jgi:hypothetical protein
MSSQFGDRPLVGLAYEVRATPTVSGCGDAGLVQEMMHHRTIERVTTLGRSPTLTIESFRNDRIALPGTMEFSHTCHQGSVSTQLVETRNRSDQLM